MTNDPYARGFTLVETLIAIGLLVTAVAGLSQLFAQCVRLTKDSGQFGVALVGAQDKLEWFRALRYAYDAAGAALTDARLGPSPKTTLSEDVDGFVDWLDATGETRAEARGAEYVRRWRITEIAADEPSAIVIDVCVFGIRALRRDPFDAEACLSTARVRQP